MSAQSDESYIYRHINVDHIQCFKNGSNRGANRSAGNEGQAQTTPGRR